MRDRSKIVGASEVAALFGESPYTSRYKLWCEKTGLIEKEDFDAPTTDRMQIGKDLEKPVLEIWSERLGLLSDHNTYSYKCRTVDGLSATPDGLIREALGEQIKTKTVATAEVKTVQPHERKVWAEMGTPRHYWWQAQAQSLVMEVPGTYLIALFGVNEIAHEWIAADTYAHARIAEEVAMFWRQVRGEAPPPDADDHRATTEALMAQRRTSEPHMFSGNLYDEVAKMHVWQKEVTKLDGWIRASKNKLLQAMNGASIGMFSDGSGFRVSTINVKEKVRKAYSFQKLTSFKGKDAEEGNEDEI